MIFISNNDEGNDSFQKQSAQYPSPNPRTKSYPFTSFQIPFSPRRGLELVKRTPAQLLDALKTHSLPCGLLVLLFQGVLQPYIPI